MLQICTKMGIVQPMTIQFIRKTSIFSAKTVFFLLKKERGHKLLKSIYQIDGGELEPSACGTPSRSNHSSWCPGISHSGKGCVTTVCADGHFQVKEITHQPKRIFSFQKLFTKELNRSQRQAQRCFH